MKRYLLVLVLPLILSSCLTATKSSYTPAQLEQIKNIDFVTFEALPADKHFKIIGQATGKYETTYGKPERMIGSMKIAAFNLGGDAMLPYTTSSQYISFANATIIHGVADVITYVAPEKTTILQDYAKGYQGGLVTRSAARFAGRYLEAIPLSRKIIDTAVSWRRSNNVSIAAMAALAEAQGADAKGYFFDIVSNANENNALHALLSIAPYLSSADTEQLVRFMKFHSSDNIKYAAAKRLIDLGARQQVEAYVETSNNLKLGQLLM